MQTLEPILAAHPFFRDLPPAYLKLLVGCATNVRFDADTFLFRAGEEANQFFLLREGAVAMEAVAPGRPPVVVQTLGAGEILGWSWLIPPYHWMFDARTIEPTRAITLDGKCLRGKCEADHDLGYELLKRISHVLWERLQAVRLQLLDAYGPPGESR
jgi:CRP/FNR family cyclic AMP-dependent transcriptional regulator